MDTLQVPTDPDFLEALKSADSLEGDARDELFVALAFIVCKVDPKVVPYLIGEISAALQIFPWIALSTRTWDPWDVEAGLKVISLYRPDAIEPGKDDEEEDFDPPTREELKAFLDVLGSCISGDWATARTLARSLKHDALRVRAHERIAVASDLPNDDRALQRLCHALERAEKSPYVSWTYERVRMDPALEFPPREFTRKLVERGNRLRSLVNLNAPVSILSAELCMLAEVGGVEEVLRVVEKMDFEFEGEIEQRYVESLATGFVVLRDLESARVWADLLAPAGRARVYMRIYAAKNLT